MWPPPKRWWRANRRSFSACTRNPRPRNSTACARWPRRRGWCWPRGRFCAPQNFGHFGLALQAYAHFTSPIRRYADLIVHRALITAHGWGKDGLSPAEIEQLENTAQHISETERRSMMAERDTNDRYLAAFLSERLGEEFTGRISGVAKFGVFVRLDETGADGLIPVRSLGREFFHFDREAGTLMGSDTGLTIGLGQP